MLHEVLVNNSLAFVDLKNGLTNNIQLLELY